MNFNFKNNNLLLVLIALISAIVFIPFIGNCHLFDWDEVNFAECAREMIVSGDYSRVQLNYRPFWEKPPFFIWLQAFSMRIFGINEFAARFPNAMCSIASFISIFLVGKKFHSQKFGLIWCLLYAASLLPHFYFKSGIIDPWFNLFIFVSVYNCILFINNPSAKTSIVKALLAGLFLGLAVLTKGPAALLVVALTLIGLFVWTRRLKLLFSWPFIVFTLTTLLVASSWFISQWLSGNGKIISEFITYQVRLFETGDAGHDGPFVYHFVVLLIGCFPASVLFMAAYLKYNNLTPYQRLFRQVFICLFWVVLIFFSITKTKIIHYSSLCYYPLTFIATIGLVVNYDSLKLNLPLKIIYWLIAGALTLAFICVGLFEFFKESILESGIIKDRFAALNLRADAGWAGFEYLLGALLVLASYYIFEATETQNEKTLYKGLVCNILFIVLVIFSIVPKIEMYSQNAAIEFYKERAKEHCYVETHGFKSYAYLFYSNRKPEDYTNPDQIAYIKYQLDLMEKEGHSRLSSYATCNLFWMEYGKIDRPAYIVVKTPDEGDLTAISDFKKLYEKNGFSFFVRYPQNTAK